MIIQSIGKIGKIFALLLTLMAAISCLTLLITEPANAQSIPSPIPIPIPTIPEFTVQLVDRSYIVPASTTIDPYTGQNVTNPSYYAENRTAEIAIKNQLFTPYYENSTGAQWKITLMYQIRTKGHLQRIGLTSTLLKMGYCQHQILNIQQFLIRWVKVQFGVIFKLTPK